MAQIGRQNSLTVLHSTPHGVYLDGGEHGEILLPNRYIPKGTSIGDVLEVFVYRDSEDRLVATTEKPFATVGEFATLEVVSVNRNTGAFLNWGLLKDLLLPFREQAEPVRVGDMVVAFILVDEKTDRIIATTRLNRHLSRERPAFRLQQPVSLLITARTPLGYNAIVEGTHLGLLYHSNVGAPLQIGQKVKGFIAAVHPGGKIDLSLDASGYQRVASLTDRILEALKNNGGRLDFDDDTSPERIRSTFDASKKAFKQALGALYKQRRLEFTRPGIAALDIREAKAGDWKPSAGGGK
ncbi:MAG: GntR family transcriptional regulator [Prosthecobacter sp.]|jgi:predicted RNA-binding protein (virulence factor B family)|uniref:CvfB family protein n=1 Tax=Prosthecobacter sp. TaxID=1965333 RepID=UPI0019E848D7|nr:S1-like domain-containing RNA-binding protein [Prosthecobacter sp.]MBE2286111.1 GntR family transcriptional regulator [Prosthecobacter sp.]